MMRITKIVGLACGLLAAGCYSYAPAQNLQPGADVRARLNAASAVARSEGLDDAIVSYTGTVVAADSESITLDVLVARDPSQFSRAEIRDTLILPRSELQSVMVRKLSVIRSVIFTAAVAGGAYAIVSGVSSIVGGNEGEPDPGNPALVPSHMTRRRGFTIRIPIP